MIWTPVAAALSLASSVATCLTMAHLRCRWDVHASSVRWLFWSFFRFVCVRCIMRSVFLLWLSSRSSAERVDVNNPESWTYGQLDRLGIHGIMYLPEARELWLATLICLGDIALFGIALTLFPLAHELGRLARRLMDRGVEKEQAQIQFYGRWITIAVASYAVAQLVLVLLYDGYNMYTHRCLLGVYAVQMTALVFMVGQLVRLKVNGRKYETIHGVFVASPIYQRLKCIMLVYAVFAFQFQFAILVMYLHDMMPDSKFMVGVGVSLIIHNVFGLAIAITTSCSVACVFSTCGRCLPEGFEAQYLHERLAGPSDFDLEAPRQNPVFVHTDIQSSSALWNVNGDAMGIAIEIHDSILRSSLLKHRGYEITTVGDAFQVAFHSIRDAIEYCMDVQLQLLVADWPKEIHGAVPATIKQRSGRRVIFNGLRVRMGIHDASEVDGKLVQDVHAITRKATYTGVSEVIAEYVGETGSGGQILITDRVASWLKHHRDDLSVDVFLEYMGEFSVPHVDTNVTIYQVLPTMLAYRAQYFKPMSKNCDVSDTTMCSSVNGESQNPSFDLELAVDTLVSPSATAFKPLQTPRPMPVPRRQSPRRGDLPTAA